MQIAIDTGIWCQRRQTGMASSPRQHTDLTERHIVIILLIFLPTSHFWSLCSTNESRKSPPKQISLLLRAHPYCILHQAVNIALQYLLTNAPKLKQISFLCCHFSPSSYRSRCILLECSYTILGRHKDTHTNELLNTYLHIPHRALNLSHL